jgi:SAM-dependent methyltransferase
VLVCAGCGRTYRREGDEFLDLRPETQFQEQTKYLDEALHADARHERVSPPLLGSRIRNDVLRAFLDPQPGDRVVDLGCGSGRALLWNRDWRSTMVGVDIAPFFSADALQEVDLLLADLRRLPFADGTFTKAYSLDVLEHLSPDALRAMLAEASRVLAPGGALFVYSHVRRNAPIAKGLRAINAFARLLERGGLIDMRQERLRKSDHVNPLRDIPELESVAAASGFRIARIRYYTPIVGGLVENILMRVAERAMARRAARRLSAAGTPDAETAAIREARRSAKDRIARSPATLAALRSLSAAMKLDLLLFGRIRSGPFFALLVKIPGPAERRR